jgi:hypothetical protein
MKSTKSRLCLWCGEAFDVDRRNVLRQKYCSVPACQKASKRASQARWLSRPENADYHKGPVAAARVAEWKKANPELVAGQRARKAAVVQDIYIVQAIELKQELSIFSNPAESSPEPESAVVQDFITVQPLVVIGLIAHFFNILVQEDMVSTTRRLQQLGEDIANGRSPDGCAKAGNLSGASAACAGAVQLGGSAPGAG